LLIQSPHVEFNDAHSTNQTHHNPIKTTVTPTVTITSTAASVAYFSNRLTDANNRQ